MGPPCNHSVSFQNRSITQHMCWRISWFFEKGFNSIQKPRKKQNNVFPAAIDVSCIRFDVDEALEALIDAPFGSQAIEWIGADGLAEEHRTPC